MHWTCHWTVVVVLCVAQTLYAAAKDASGTSSAQEKTYAQMPAGYEIAPSDDAGIAMHVIAPYRWDVYRLCTLDKCYATLYYGSSAGTVKDSTGKWETNGAGEYRIGSLHNDWYRLLIRSPCFIAIVLAVNRGPYASASNALVPHGTVVDVTFTGSQATNAGDVVRFMPLSNGGCAGAATSFPLTHDGGIRYCSGSNFYPAEGTDWAYAHCWQPPTDGSYSYNHAISECKRICRGPAHSTSPAATCGGFTVAFEDVMQPISDTNRMTDCCMRGATSNVPLEPSYVAVQCYEKTLATSQHSGVLDASRSAQLQLFLPGPSVYGLCLATYVSGTLSDSNFVWYPYVTLTVVPDLPPPSPPSAPPPPPPPSPPPPSPSPPPPSPSPPPPSDSTIVPSPGADTDGEALSGTLSGVHIEGDEAILRFGPLEGGCYIRLDKTGTNAVLKTNCEGLTPN